MSVSPRFLVLPAAGLGTRMKAVNPDIPKEMLPIGGVPAICYAIQEGLDLGVEEIIIVISHRKEEIRKYLDEKYAGTTVRLTFIYQEELRGESDAISMAADIVGNNSLAVIYPDNIFLSSPGVLKTLTEVFQKWNKDVVALSQVTADNADGLGNAGSLQMRPYQEDVFQIEKFLPKGAGFYVPRFAGELRACGIFVFGPHLFDCIEKVRPKDYSEEFTDVAVKNLIAGKMGFLGCRLSGSVYDIGNPRGYELCLKNGSKLKAESGLKFRVHSSPLAILN